MILWSSYFYLFLLIPFRCLMRMYMRRWYRTSLWCCRRKSMSARQLWHHFLLRSMFAEPSTLYTTARSLYKHSPSGQNRRTFHLMPFKTIRWVYVWFMLPRSPARARLQWPNLEMHLSARHAESVPNSTRAVSGFAGGLSSGLNHFKSAWLSDCHTQVQWLNWLNPLRPALLLSRPSHNALPKWTMAP